MKKRSIRLFWSRAFYDNSQILLLGSTFVVVVQYKKGNEKSGGITTVLNWLKLVLLLFVLSPNKSHGLDWVVEFGLKRGENKVAVVSFSITDNSREIYDSMGNRVAKRKVQGLIWAPLKKTAQAKKVNYLELVQTVDDSVSMTQIVHQYQRKGADASRVRSILEDTKLPLLHEDINNSKKPLVIYYPGFGSQPFDNAVFNEYLASHGFIVIALFHQGNGAFTSYPSKIDLQAAVEDMSYTLGHFNQNADGPRFIATMGHSWGGMAAYALAAKNPMVDAVISLDSSLTAKDYGHFAADVASHEQLANMATPVLAFVSAGYHHDYSVFSKKKFGPSVLVKSWHLGHPDFTSTGQLLFRYASSSDKQVLDSEFGRSYAEVLSSSLTFLTKILNNNDPTVINGERVIVDDASFTYSAIKGAQSLPTKSEFEAMLQNPRQIPEAVKQFHRMQMMGENLKRFSKELALAMADSLMLEKETQLARMIYGMAVNAYPNSAETQFAQGKYYEQMGESQVATLYYAAAAAIDPNHEAAKKNL